MKKLFGTNIGLSIYFFSFCNNKKNQLSSLFLVCNAAFPCVLFLPFQDDSHFKQFEIKFRKKESKDDVEKVLSSLEKDKLL